MAREQTESREQPRDILWTAVLKAEKGVGYRLATLTTRGDRIVSGPKLSDTDAQVVVIGKAVLVLEEGNP